MKYGRAVHAKATRNVVAKDSEQTGRGYPPWFYYTILRVGFAPSRPEGDVAMPSLSEGQLRPKDRLLRPRFPPKPEISGL